MILLFDTETTGLTLHPDAPSHKQPKIIEIGAVLLSPKTGKVVDELSELIHPEEEVTEEITKITGITNAMLEGKPTFVQTYHAIKKFFAKAKSICAHNTPFDRDMLLAELTRHQLTDFPWVPVNRMFCTMNMYFPEWGRNPKLIELYEAKTGKKYVQTHRALDDVKLMVEVIQKDEAWRFMA